MNNSAFNRLIKATPDVYEREGIQLTPQWMNDQELYAELTGGIGQDYDYGVTSGRDSRGHGSDKGKLPWHPTFSTQSAFTTEKTPGGKWENIDGIDVFTPHASQITPENNMDNLKAYFNEVEPGTILMPP